MADYGMKFREHAFMYVNGSGTDEQILTAIRTADEFLVSLGYLKGKPTLGKRK